eukprot:1832849-Rhodomonas_salina.1
MAALARIGSVPCALKPLYWTTAIPWGLLRSLWKYFCACDRTWSALLDPSMSVIFCATPGPSPTELFPGIGSVRNAARVGQKRFNPCRCCVAPLVTTLGQRRHTSVT